MKKRLSALFVAICLMATCLPFSAIVSADTPVSDGVAGYIVKAPADKDSAASGAIDSDALLDVAGQAITVRHENGENFFVIDEAISTKGNTATDVAANFYAQGMNAAGLPAGLEVKDDSMIAIRFKLNENTPAYDVTAGAFRIYLAAKGGAVEEDYSERANTVVDVTNTAKWLDLVDGTLTKLFPADGGNGVVANVNKYIFKGDMDGYILLPLKLFGDAYTAEQVKANFTSLIIAPFVTNANDDDHVIADPVENTAKIYTLRNREALIGDIAVVNDVAAFQAAKTAGITKYATGLDDGAFYAQNLRGYRNTFGNNFDAYIIPDLGKQYGAPNQPNTGYYGFVHKTTLPNGDMAFAYTYNASRADGTGKACYITNLDTYEGVNVDTSFANADYAGSYASSENPGVPAALGITKNTGLALRLAITGNEGKTSRFEPMLVSKKDNFGYLVRKEGSVVKFVDANTGAVTEYTVTATGIDFTGNVDGYLIIPDLTATYFYNPSSHADFNSFRGMGGRMMENKINSWKEGQTVYIGDALWLTDVDKFVAVRTSCDVLGHDFQTKSVTPANCTEPKKYNQECSRCDATNVVTEGEALGHTWGAPTIVEADCVNGGYDLYKCTVAGCGVEKKENETQAKGHGHKEGLVEQKADPGLHTPGSTVTYCGDCGDIIKEASVIEPTCKETETKLINVKAATCKEDGYTGDKVCVACETVIEKGKVDPKLPHTEKTVNAKEATCKEAGYTGDVVCDVCKEEIKKGEATDKLPHTEKTVNAKEATCKEAGYTGDVVCDVCDEEIKKGEAVAKLDHTYGDWEETKAPTATEKGEKERECSACGDVEKAEIPATGTATGDGNNEGGNANKPSSPNTGDNNSILWVVLMAITAGAVLTVVAKKRCK